MSLPRIDTQIHATRYRADTPKEDVTVAACLQRCAEVGIEHAGIIEHLGNWRHPVECLEDLAAEFRALTPPIPASIGVEMRVMDTDGNLNGDQALLERIGLDFTLVESEEIPDAASGIDSVQGFIEFDHRCQMGAVLQNPWIDVVVHPWGTHRKRLRKLGYEGEWRFDMVPEAFLWEWVDALADRDTACEVNSKNIPLFNHPTYNAFIERLISRRIRIAIGSDSHDLSAIGTAAPIYDFLESKGAPPDLIFRPPLPR
jgi:histidinol phosphatase-like PHP family hydrolase